MFEVSKLKSINLSQNSLVRGTGDADLTPLKLSVRKSISGSCINKKVNEVTVVSTVLNRVRRMFLTAAFWLSRQTTKCEGRS